MVSWCPGFTDFQFGTYMYFFLPGLVLVPVGTGNVNLTRLSGVESPFMILIPGIVVLLAILLRDIFILGKKHSVQV